jgi:hypothetical protein
MNLLRSFGRYVNVNFQKEGIRRFFIGNFGAYVIKMEQEKGGVLVGCAIGILCNFKTH